MTAIKGIFARLFGPDLLRRANRSKVDEQTSFFPVTRYMWRIVREGLSVDVYAESDSEAILVDPMSMDCWRARPYELPSNMMFDDSPCQRAIDDDERGELLDIVRAELERRFNKPVIIKSERSARPQL